MCIDTIKKDYLSFKGRLNRKAFIIRSLWLALVAVVIFLPIIAVSSSTQSEMPLYFFYVLNLLFVWIGMAIYILFFKGTTGTNNFGEDPLEASVVPSLAE